jgi:hypothetical protein
MERTFWRAFNAGVRVVGIAFVGAGAVVALSGLGVIPYTDQPPPGAEATYVVMTPGSWWLIGVVIMLIGLPMLFVRSYRPDLGDVERLAHPFGARGNSKHPRTWWTGQPK